MDIKELLEEKYDLYNRPSFIDTDPIQIPHRFSKHEDIEIAGFLASAIAWGNRKAIIKSANRMVNVLGNNPHEFILNATENDFQKAQGIVHRTFSDIDFIFFLKSLQNIYINHKGLKGIFSKAYKKTKNVFESIGEFRKVFFEIPHLQRAEKHIANVDKNSAAKRINMFLMWLVRKDNRGVHFGIWNNIIPMSKLMLPLDVHTGNISRKLGLLNRKQNDKKAVSEITQNLTALDKDDPVKYDFALFGLGVFDKIK